MRVIHQNEVAECGYACLAMVLAHHGRATEVAELSRWRPISANGLKMSDLYDAAQAFGLRPLAFTFDASDLRKIRKGSILHFGGAHFLVFQSAHRGYVRVIDPAVGRRRISLDAFQRYATGYLLQFERTPQLQRIHGGFPVWQALRQVVRANPALPGRIGRILFAGVAAQLAVLAMPYLGRLVLDEVVVQDNLGLLNILAMTFASIFAAGVVSHYAQRHLLELVCHRAELRTSAGLFQRLLSNPLGYFEKRNVGDLYARFKAQSEVTDYAVRTPVEVALNLLIGLLALLLMLVHSPLLSLLSLGVFALYLIVAFALYPRMRDLHQEEVLRTAECDDMLIETVRGAALLKLAQAEPVRVSMFMERMTGWAAAALQHRNLGNVRDAILKAVEYGDTLLLTYVAASLMLAGKVSVGTFYSFIIYKSLMSARLALCINALFAGFMLRVPVERVRDITACEPERYTPPERMGKSQEIARFDSLALRGVGFRYGASDAPVLQDLDLDIRRGDKIAIEGPSGSGKSTLFKLLAAAEQPGQGAMALNGIAWPNLAVDEVRRHMAHMRQGDIILHGSIADNVSLFEANPDEARILQLLEATGLLEEVMALPMRLQTRISDTIANISAGQRQRLLLARAVYAQRELLLLDEPTSNLDPASVDRVARVLLDLPRTLVVITHDARLAAVFEHRYRLREGRLVEVAAR